MDAAIPAVDFRWIVGQGVTRTDLFGYRLECLSKVSAVGRKVCSSGQGHYSGSVEQGEDSLFLTKAGHIGWKRNRIDGNRGVVGPPDQIALIDWIDRVIAIRYDDDDSAEPAPASPGRTAFKHRYGPVNTLKNLG